jgi:citrate/tricarballylate utilization protein
LQHLTELIARARGEVHAPAEPRVIQIQPVLPLTATEQEVARILQICNACRYCEGFCAVFPAMTRRLEFGKADVHYLANLCHNCGSCLPACQYALPHEFNVNVPKAMARVRAQTYQDYAWPAAAGALYRRAGLATALALSGALAICLASLLAITGTLVNVPMSGNFYAIFSHSLLAWLFGVAFVYAACICALGVYRFWNGVSQPKDRSNEQKPRLAPEARSSAAAEAIQDVLVLKYLGGGHGEGCNDEDDRFTLWRRRFHHATFYGFALCFASTAVATLYHYALGRHAPYPLASPPVVLGTTGGIGLTVGTLGLWWLGSRRNPASGDPAQLPMDRAFIALLLMTSITGLALLALRDSSLMGLALATHLGVVLALFITLPYGKFAHGIYRCAALLKFALEKRSPSQLSLGED